MEKRQELYNKEEHKITNWLVDLAVFAQCDAFHKSLKEGGLEWHHSSYNEVAVEIPEDPKGLFWEVKDSVGDLKVVIDALVEAGYSYEVYWWMQQYTVGDDPKVHEDPHWLIWLPELPKINA